MEGLVTPHPPLHHHRIPLLNHACIATQSGSCAQQATRLLKMVVLNSDASHIIFYSMYSTRQGPCVGTPKDSCWILKNISGEHHFKKNLQESK
jgi:hypothetical protein